jgi:hypothetical protein
MGGSVFDLRENKSAFYLVFVECYRKDGIVRDLFYSV